MSSAWILPDAAAIVACAIAVVTDLRAMRIPNWLTVSTLLVGLTANAGVALWVGGDVLHAGLLPALYGASFLFAVFLLLSALRVMGMGDTKLVCAAGACIRWPAALPALVYILIAGGAWALIIVARRRGIRAEASSELQDSRIPYAPAILVGVAYVIASRYVPELRFL